MNALASFPQKRFFRLRQSAPLWAYRSFVVGSFLVALAAWAWISHQSWTNPIFIPKPEVVADVARTFFSDAQLWSDVKVSFLRVTYGFLLSVAIAVPVGVLIGSFHLGEGFVQPLTEFIRYVPVPALIPILMVLFGIGEMSKIMLIFVGTYFQLVLMVADEVRRVSYELIQVACTLGARRNETIRLVLFRAALPGIFDAMRLCNGWAWTYVVVAELVAANEGLGYRILKFSRFLQTPKIWVYLIVLGVIGLALDLAFRAMNRRLFQWADTSRR
jgi:NitT/TauT family transport system permease protein